jgi:hypothetical protein
VFVYQPPIVESLEESFISFIYHPPITESSAASILFCIPHQINPWFVFVIVFQDHHGIAAYGENVCITFPYHPPMVELFE